MRELQLFREESCVLAIKSSFPTTYPADISSYLNLMNVLWALNETMEFCWLRHESENALAFETIPTSSFSLASCDDPLEDFDEDESAGFPVTTWFSLVSSSLTAEIANS